jgi:cytochrome P450
MTISPAIPAPPPAALGFTGTLLRFFRDPVAHLSDLHLRYGDVVRLAPKARIVFAFGPAHNHAILSAPGNFENQSLVVFPTPEGSAARRLETVLLAMNGERHKQQRRLMLPAFHRQQVAGYHNTIVAVAERAIAGLRPGAAVDMLAAVKRITLNVASVVLFGRDDGDQADSVGRMIDTWCQLLFNPWVIAAPISAPLTPYRRALRHAERLEAATRAVIAEKRARLAGANDVLAALIQAHDEDGARLSDEELVGHVNGLFLAGHETTASALAWALFLLAAHPALAADLHDELDQALGGAPPTLEQVGRLPLLDGVLKETLRILPPVVHGVRRTPAPARLGPYELPAGALVGFSQYVTHHMPEIYPRPERFDPRRWETISPSAYAFLPFGAGVHMCLGASFAQLEMKIVLAMLLQRFRFELPHAAQVDRGFGLTMVPRGGLAMRLHAQDRAFTAAEVRGNVREMVELG